MSERDDLETLLQDNISDSLPSDPSRAEIREQVNVAFEVLWNEGYRKPRTITTVDELTQLHALTVVLYNDMENGGPIKPYIIPDDGTVMFRDPSEFHFNDFQENYVYAKDMPLPVTVLWEAP